MEASPEIIVENITDKIGEKTEKQIEKIVEKEVKQEVAKKEISKKEGEEIKKEIKKRLSERFLEQTKKSADDFRKEFKKQTVVAITAAFGFLIALSWREPISEGVSGLINLLGLSESLIYYKFLAAIVITLVAVLFLVVLSKWNSEKK